jgi:Na+/citrate or Na+/malate symporter
MMLKKRKNRGFVSFLHFIWFYKREEEEEVVLQENAIQIAMNAWKEKEYCSQVTHFPLFIISFLLIIYFISIFFHFYYCSNFLVGFAIFVLVLGFFLYFVG